MANYDKFSRFYDSVMGTREKSAVLVKELIQKDHPNAKTVLELACGTGSILAPLAEDYSVIGIDLSEGMLRVARRKVPSAKLFKQDITKFKIPQKVDVIFCVFDSINHLLQFSDWQKVFRLSYQNLNPDGVFIFDINTKKKLDEVASDPAYVRNFGNSTMIMNVMETKKGLYDWYIKVFDHQAKDKYKLYEEHIFEVTFPVEKVKTALKKFKKVTIDPTSKKGQFASDRLVFVCKK